MTLPSTVDAAPWCILMEWFYTNQTGFVEKITEATALYRYILHPHKSRSLPISSPLTGVEWAFGWNIVLIPDIVGAQAKHLADRRHNY